MFKRVFILGAGSNTCYGFPTGGELRNLIVSEVIQNLKSEEFRLYDEFIVFFRESGMQSVDRFLELNPKYQDIGKKVISWFIARKEIPDQFKTKIDHWYFYLFNRILQEIHTLEEGEISLITFNYDRSLEYYFNQSLVNTFLMKADHDSQPDNWVKEATQLKKYRSIFNIEHVYGQVGPLFSNLPGTLIRDYSPPTRFNDLNNFYHGIHLVENRQENHDHFMNIQKIVKEADIIYCIGFGFDVLNMERVGLAQSALKCKAIFATSRDIGLAERISISNYINVDIRNKFRWYDPDKNITKFLRDLYVNDESFISKLLERSLHPEDGAHMLLSLTKTGATRPIKVL